MFPTNLRILPKLQRNKNQSKNSGLAQELPRHVEPALERS